MVEVAIGKCVHSTHDTHQVITVLSMQIDQVEVDELVMVHEVPHLDI